MVLFFSFCRANFHAHLHFQHHWDLVTNTVFLSRKYCSPAPSLSFSFLFLSTQQGHRRGVEPCSWVLRNFVRIVAVLLFVVGILVNYDIVVGNDTKAGGTG